MNARPEPQGTGEGPSRPVRMRLHPWYPRNLILAALALLAFAAYGWWQPRLNRHFGWQLPAISQFFQEPLEDQSPAPPLGAESGQEASPLAEAGPPDPAATGQTSHSGTPGAWDELEQLLAGLPAGALEDLGGRRYRSPAGLIYGPGSAEGHRLQHLARHVEDLPDRPGPHGVFNRPLADVLPWIDQVYRQAEQRGAGVTRRIEGRRTILEGRFEQPIGYVGGRAGAERGHPAARRIRLVLEGRNVITAFPF